MSISDDLKLHYQEAFALHGQTARGVDWGDEELAKVRHLQFLRLLQSSADGRSLLDVGCGFGAFNRYLADKGLEFDYTGIDIVDEMVQAAQESQPGAEFFCTDFLQWSTERTFDYVICNGIFTQKLKNTDREMEEYTVRVIRRMFELANVGIAFNLLTDLVDFRNPGNFYFGPAELIPVIAKLSRRFEIVHSYPLFEYTTLIYKQQ